MKIDCAGIVTYNPEIKRLKQNISAIKKQVSLLIIVDNGSSNIKEIQNSIEDEILLIKNEKNLGIATALNQICENALRRKYDWCLLLDQDSICSENIIKNYSPYTKETNNAILCPFIIDEYKISIKQYKNMKLPSISCCNYAITSGSFISLKIWESLDGFMDELFIDGVDSDYSFNVRCHGYRILRVNMNYILHEQGDKTEKTHIYRIHKDESGKKTIKPAYRFNYSLIRWYYMARNNLIIIKKYKKLNGFIKPIINYCVRFLSVILIERQKSKVISSIWKGITEGLNYKVAQVEVDEHR